jgi:hypothetical protein
MVRSPRDNDGSVRRLLEPWYAKAALVTLGLILVTVVLNAMPTVHDPTEGVSPVTVVNSLNETVDVGMCADRTCRSTVDGHTLRPGASFWQNVGPDSAVPLKISASDGTPLGCWLLPARTRSGHYTVRITSTVPCSSLA